MLETLLQLDPLHNPVGVGLAAVPALVNLGILAFSVHALPRDRTTRIFVLFVVGLVVWQAFDICVRSATSVETAEAWRALLRLGQFLAIPAGVHFALQFGRHDRVASHPLVVAILYVPPLMFDAFYQAGFIREDLFHHPIWGYITRQDPAPAFTVCVTWFSLLALALPALLALDVVRTRHDPQRRAAARLLAGGIAVPVGVGVLTEAVMPQLLGMQQIPITSTTLSAFSLAAAVALGRHELFRVSTPAAAQAVLETVGDALLIFAPTGQVLFANDRAAATFRLDRDRLSVHTVADLFTARADADALVAGGWRGALAGDTAMGVDVELAGADGPFPALLSLAPVPIRRHGDPGVVMVVHDVTEIRRTQAALAQARVEAEAANRAKSLFLANMSHELRTPLNAIIGYAELLSEEAEDDEALVPHLDDLRRIERSGQYLLQLIHDILDLSKVESGMLEVRSEPVVIEPLVVELAAMAEELCRRNGNRFVLDAVPCVVRADRVRVRQILLNLISNAAKFTDDGEVTLRIACDREFARFDVVDTGVGMNASQLSRLFQLFVQVHDDRTGKRGGTGLGLALSKRLAEMMGGDITVASEPGVGTTFTVRLPLDAEARAVA